MTEHAFINRDPDTVTLYLDACEQRRAQAQRIYADATTLFGGVPDHLMATGDSIGAPRISGLPQHGDFIPEGWRAVRGQLEPRRGKPGDDARAWLAGHQPIDVRGIMAGTGLSRNCSYPSGGGYRISTPNLFHHDGALFARYAADPNNPDHSAFSDGTCTWDPIPLSHWYAAREAADHAEKDPV